MIEKATLDILLDARQQFISEVKSIEIPAFQDLIDKLLLRGSTDHSSWTKPDAAGPLTALEADILCRNVWP